MRDTHSYEDYLKLSRFRESINQSDSILNIKDYGAGSRVFKTNDRAVKDILKYNCSTVKDSQLLYRICQYLKVTNVLELGTSLGIAAHAMSIARPQAQITTIEGSAEVHEFAQDQLIHSGIENVNCIVSTFQDFFKNQTSNTTIYDLIYIDGHHNGDATLSYFESILDKVHNDTVVVFDDIYWSPDMTCAWNKICKHEKVTASVDCFDFGMVFFREEQSQERFYVKL